MPRFSLTFLKTVSLFLLAIPGFAQQEPTTSVTDATATGAKPFGSYLSSDIDYVDLNNGGVNIKIPIYGKEGRGVGFNLLLTYSSKIWYVGQKSTADGPTDVWKREIQRGGGMGWNTGSPLLSSVKLKQCGLQYWEKGFVFRDSDGAKHSFANTTFTTCYPAPVLSDYSKDMTGLQLITQTTMNGTPKVVMRNGVQLLFNKIVLTGTGYNYYLPDIIDTNGNKITSTYSAGPPAVETWTDTLGRTVAVLSYAANGPLSTVQFWDSTGTARQITLSWQSLTPVCNFQQPTCAYYVPGSSNVLSQIALPNGLSYTFSYADQYGVTNPFGELMKVTLPTGGYIRYEYTTLPAGESNPQGIDFGRIDSRVVTKRAVSPDGTTEHPWLYSYGRTGDSWTITEKTTTVTDPLGNQSVFTFQPQYSQFHETNRDIKNSSGVSLQRIQQTWAFDAGGYNARVATRTQTLSDTSQVSQTTYAYDQFTEGSATLTRGNITEVQEFGYGSGGPGPLVRRTVSTFLAGNDANYQTRHIWDRVSLKQVYDGSGNLKAQSASNYDTTSIQSASNAAQHDYTNYPAWMTYRGNATESKRWRNTDGAWLTTTHTYDELGNLRQSQDPLTHITTYSYADAWRNTACAPLSGTAQAYLTQVTNHLGHIERSTYDSCSATVASTTDANNQTTDFTYDLLGRLTQTLLPPNAAGQRGQTNVAFNEASFPFSVTTTTKIDAAQNLVNTSVVDRLGRVVQTQQNSNPLCVVKVDTTYDALGRKASVNNPYCTTSDGVTTFQYDALGRITKVIPQDGSVGSNHVLTQYSGNVTTVTDQAGKQRRSTTDALGRLNQVDEPNPTLSTPAVTTYTYNVLDNLTSVLQSGSRQRTFEYNSLSQLTSATNPESGAISYTYDNDGNLLTKTSPKPNQTNPAITVTATHTYDALHRLTQKSFDDGLTPTQTLTYDVQTDGWQTANWVGRLTRSCWQGSYADCDYFGYDAVGKVTRHQQGGGLWPSAIYTYNLAGGVTQLDYYEYYLSRVRSIGYAYDSAGRVSQVKELNGAQKVYADNIQYHPHGAWSSMTLSNGAMQQTAAYNNRLQPTSKVVSDVSPAVTIMNFTYTFTNGQGQNNANVVSMWDNVQVLNYGFQYDELNRLSRAETLNTASWGNTYGYDIWGNLHTKAQIPGKTQGEFFSQTPNTNNQFVGWSYDAAGNLLNDGAHNYQFDPEGRIKCMDAAANCTNPAASYVYSIEGRRVKRTTGGATTLYLHQGGSVLSEFNNPSQTVGTWQKDYIYLNGQLLATESATDGTRYHFSDHLGTPRVITDAAGDIISRHDYYPYGKEIGASTDGETHKFTGKERDAESGLDYFGARYYASLSGRFLSTDSVVWSRAMGNPQTWNKYSYAFNQPTRLIDPDGRWPSEFHQQVIRDVFGDLGRAVVQRLIQSDQWMDSWANQASNRSFMHSMSDGDASQTPQQAEFAATAYIQGELTAAVDAQIAFEARGGRGNSLDAMNLLGHAVHTAVDATSPQHAGFQPWYGQNDAWGAQRHTSAEQRSMTSNDANSARARMQARAEAIRVRAQYEGMLNQRRADDERKKKEVEDKKKSKGS